MASTNEPTDDDWNAMNEQEQNTPSSNDSYVSDAEADSLERTIAQNEGEDRKRQIESDNRAEQIAEQRERQRQVELDEERQAASKTKGFASDARGKVAKANRDQDIANDYYDDQVNNQREVRQASLEPNEVRGVVGGSMDVFGGLRGSGGGSVLQDASLSPKEMRNTLGSSFDVFGGVRGNKKSSPRFSEGLTQSAETLPRSPIKINKQSASINPFAGLFTPEKNKGGVLPGTNMFGGNTYSDMDTFFAPRESPRAARSKPSSNNLLDINPFGGAPIPKSKQYTSDYLTRYKNQFFLDKTRKNREDMKRIEDAQAASKLTMGIMGSALPSRWGMPMVSDEKVSSIPSKIKPGTAPAREHVSVLDKFYGRIQGKGLSEHQQAQEEKRIEKLGGFFGNWVSKPEPLTTIATDKQAYMNALMKVQDVPIKKLTAKQQEEQDRKDTAKITGQQGLWTVMHRNAKAHTIQVAKDTKAREEKERTESDLRKRANRPIQNLTSFNELIRDTKRRTLETSEREERTTSTAHKEELRRDLNTVRSFKKRQKEEAVQKDAIKKIWTTFEYDIDADARDKKNKRDKEIDKARIARSVNAYYVDMEDSERKKKYRETTTPIEQLWDRGTKRKGSDPWNYDIRKQAMGEKTSPWSERHPVQSKILSNAKGNISKPWDDLIAGREDRAATHKKERGFLYGGGLQPSGVGTPGYPRGYFPAKSGYPTRPRNPLAHSELMFFGNPRRSAFGIRPPLKGTLNKKTGRIKISAAERRRAQKARSKAPRGFFDDLFGGF